jgi:deoxyribonuclease-4
MGEGEAAGLRRVAKSLDEAHKATRGFCVRTLLETTAGQGTSLGHRFEHLGAILAKVRKPERLGICFDTCHVFAAGYRMADPGDYAATMAKLDRAVGLDQVKCFHVNDSLRECGSRVDRHAHIGQGCVGRGAFRNLVTDPRFPGVRMILETPKGEDDRGRDWDRVNLAKLRRMERGGSNER